ncbi:MAG: hypothetical protein PVJ09_01875 [Candidatus Woesebacteria bacterium]|jgi:hypothetical protein
MQNIFKLKQFEFPYHYKFPGQASDEQILFVTRENKLLLKFRRMLALLLSLLLLILAWWLLSNSTAFLSAKVLTVARVLSLLLALSFLLIAWYWITNLWQKSIAILTNKRLTKFIYTTPVNRHSLSLPLEMIVDTGAYSKGFIQSFFNLGTLTARSSASSSGVATDDSSRINKKYFYIKNISFSEDLQQYINKLLSLFRANKDLSKFRPFIPELKGEARKQFMANYPEYWS